MKRFIQGEHRGQGTLLPESLDDYVDSLGLSTRIGAILVGCHLILMRRWISLLFSDAKELPFK